MTRYEIPARVDNYRMQANADRNARRPATPKQWPYAVACLALAALAGWLLGSML